MTTARRMSTCACKVDAGSARAESRDNEGASGGGGGGAEVVVVVVVACV